MSFHSKTQPLAPKRRFISSTNTSDRKELNTCPWIVASHARNGQGANTVPGHHAVRHDVRGPHLIGY